MTGHLLIDILERGTREGVGVGRPERADEVRGVRLLPGVAGWLALCAALVCGPRYLSRAQQATPQAGAETRLALPAVDGAAAKGKPVSVAQLEAMLAEIGKKRDSAAARELYKLRLTERLSSAKLAAMRDTLHGSHARAALTAVGDVSVFLSLPGGEIPVAIPPDMTEQRRMVTLAVEYFHDTLPKLPNFFATRTTIRYDDTSEDPEHPGVDLALGEPLHETNRSSAIVVYRDHKEVVNAAKAHRREPYEEEKGLVTRGTFGPILSTVLYDAAHGQVTFSHWEQGVSGPVAVFHLRVLREQSHYDVAYRRVGETAVNASLERPTAYQAEISIDPASGAILRLALTADLEPDADIVRADVMVEYAPVAIGGTSYICPVRSVAYSVGRVMMRGRLRSEAALQPEGEVTRLNDVVFGDYHLFRSEVRMLSEDEAAREEKQ